MNEGQLGKSPSPENVSKGFQNGKHEVWMIFFTVLSCFPVVCGIKPRKNISVDSCHFPSRDDPFARILKL